MMRVVEVRFGGWKKTEALSMRKECSLVEVKRRFAVVASFLLLLLLQLLILRRLLSLRREV